MIRRLMARMWLWMHDICPKHGEQMKMFKRGRYCEKCQEEERAEYQAQIRRAIEALGR